MRIVVLVGSSRKNGNTRKLVDDLHQYLNFDVIDLNDYNIGYYDYKHLNSNDDYLILIQRLIEKYDTWIFATPVYWYSMSGIMKVFFDRITDLLDDKKDLGRQLRGKNMAALSSSIGDHLDGDFWKPFIGTARYLGMNYLGHMHTLVNENYTELVKSFSERIKKEADCLDYPDRSVNERYS
jgi:multimeric flavodoxin WrbA